MWLRDRDRQDTGLYVHSVTQWEGFDNNTDVMSCCREDDNGLRNEAWLGQGRTDTSTSRLHSSSLVRTHTSTAAVRLAIQRSANQTERCCRQGIRKCATATATSYWCRRQFEQLGQRVFNVGWLWEGKNKSSFNIAIVLSLVYSGISCTVI